MFSPHWHEIALNARETARLHIVQGNVDAALHMLRVAARWHGFSTTGHDNSAMPNA